MDVELARRAPVHPLIGRRVALLADLAREAIVAVGDGSGEGERVFGVLVVLHFLVRGGADRVEAVVVGAGVAVVREALDALGTGLACEVVGDVGDQGELVVVEVVLEVFGEESATDVEDVVVAGVALVSPAVDVVVATRAREGFFE
ncbi:hypothetical protein QJS10_CPA03g02496 [Acorus calamus]|uniref:Uncharacterized protein n=1 Tax=Acorus calamus TaxID=4465 RepID=A0AAV9FB56_ACOCL|nr:hypothetical protein QJS10_CPA03g02496 [Acorus calamus]